MHPLLSAFERSVQSRPEHVAAGDQSLALDYRSFHATACGLAERVGAARPAQNVGILAPSSTAASLGIYACWYAGKTPVPLNFMLAPEELGRILKDAQVDLLLSIAHFSEAVAATGLKSLMLDANTLTPGACDAPAADPHETGILIYTSGTSGDPKGVCLTYDNLLRNAQTSIEHMRLDPGSVFLSVLPPFHCFGLTLGTVMPLVLGATVWYLPRFSPLAIVNMIADKHVTVFPAIASMYAALCKLKKTEPAALRTLSLAISGGEPLSPTVAEAFKQRFEIDIHEGYGLTETSPVVACNVPWDRKLGSVGKPLPGVEVYAVGAGGERLKADEEGELAVRGHCVMHGYRNQPEATAAAIRDGVFYTGDIGKIDADGFVYITGRAREMIIVGGENVFPREIEAVLSAHPAVTEAAVVGKRDPVRGELPIAFVTLEEGRSVDANELRNFCRERLASYKVPRDVRFVKDFPRGPTGKVLKRALVAD